MQVSNFINGEIAPDYQHSRSNSATLIENGFITQSGAIIKRSGLQVVARLLGVKVGDNFNFIPFVGKRSFLLVLVKKQLTVFENTKKIAELTLENSYQAPHFVQLRDGILLLSSRYPPTFIKPVFSEAAGSQPVTMATVKWQASKWQYTRARVSNKILHYPLQPFANFALPGITIDTSDQTGNVSMTCSQDYWTPQHVGLWIRYNDGLLVIRRYVNSKIVIGDFARDMTKPVGQSSDWSEQAFSPLRGWPSMAVVHRNRLWLAGAGPTQHILRASHAGDLSRFLPLSNRADEPLAISLIGDSPQKIVAMTSAADHLRVFSENGQWVISGDTPQTVTVKQYGAARNVSRAINLEDSTVFAAQNGNSIRELHYIRGEGIYKLRSLSDEAHHLLKGVVAFAYDYPNRRLFCVLKGGDVAVASVFFGEAGIHLVWSRLTTASGKVITACYHQNSVWFLVKRGKYVVLEMLEASQALDFALTKIPDGKNALRLQPFESEILATAKGVVIQQDTKKAFSANAKNRVPTNSSAVAKLGVEITTKIIPTPLEGDLRLVKVMADCIDSDGFDLTNGTITTRINPPFDSPVVCRYPNRSNEPLWQISTKNRLHLLRIKSEIKG